MKKITILLFLLTPILFSQTTIHIPDDLPTIQEGIDSSNIGDTVLVSDGVYFENINFRGKAITVASSFIIDSDSSHIKNTIIDGSQPVNSDTASVVTFYSGEDTSSVLMGFTIRGGTGTLLSLFESETDRVGGGILCLNAGPTIKHNRITNNSAIIDSGDGTIIAVGGGIFAYEENGATNKIIIQNNTIDSNFTEGSSQAVAGGIFLDMNADVKNNRISENIASSTGDAIGGGITAYAMSENHRSVKLIDNQILKNRVITNSQDNVAQGGGVLMTVHHVNIIGNTIKDNEVSSNIISVAAGMMVMNTFPTYDNRIEGNLFIGNNSIHGYLQGGGIYIFNSPSVSFVNNDISNHSASVGGGIIIDQSNLMFKKNRINNNNATDVGGGIIVVNSTPLIQNNLIAQNSSDNGGAGLWIEKNYAQSTTNTETKINSSKFNFTITNIDKFLNRDILTQKDIAQTYSEELDAQLINNTIVDNIALGGLGGGGINAILSSPLLMNNIIWGNDDINGNQIEGSVFANYCNIEGGYEGLGNLDLDPQFVDNEQYFLGDFSPSIDAGNPDPTYNDIEDMSNLGFALLPAKGTTRNDMGAYGGNTSITHEDNFKGPQFREFVERVKSANYMDRSAIVDSFMNAVDSFPFIEESTIVYFLFRGNQNQVNIAGDANGWNGEGFPMKLLSTTDLWYREAVYESDARLDYKYVLNGATWILDPLNPNTVSGGFGPNSELAMPDYVQPSEIIYNPSFPHGTMNDTLLKSSYLNNQRRVYVYTPPEYKENTSAKYPMILFHDGTDYLSLGSVKNILDNLISEKKINPVIAVLVPPVDRENEYAFNQTDKFASFIVEEVVPYIDSHYRTFRYPEFRAMTGPSYGGLITTQICYEYSEVFGLSAPISPSYWAKDMAVYNMVVNGPKKEIKFYIDWGRYELGIMQDSRTLRDELISNGYELTWKEWNEGHSWGSWRAHLDNVLEYFFPYDTTTVVNEKLKIPDRYELVQNYPNPFNPSTTITYSVPQKSEVRLEIFNMLGQRIDVLVNNVSSAGSHEINWDASGFSSGIYMYRLSAISLETRKVYQSVKKMILMK